MGEHRLAQRVVLGKLNLSDLPSLLGEFPADMPTIRGRQSCRHHERSLARINHVQMIMMADTPTIISAQIKEM